MKKVILFFAVATAVALASCGGQATQPETPAADQTEAVAPEVTTDDAAAVVDTAAAAVQDAVK